MTLGAPQLAAVMSLKLVSHNLYMMCSGGEYIYTDGTTRELECLY